MDYTNIFFLLALAVVVGIILRPEIALLVIGALMTISAPFLAVFMISGAKAILPTIVFGALLMGVSDLIKNSRDIKLQLRENNEALIRVLKRQAD